MKIYRVLAVALLAVIGVVAISAQSTPSVAIVNGDFEGGFSVRGASEVEVANGWDPAWLNSDRQCPSPCARPEFKPESIIKAQGDFSQRWFTTFARQFAAIYQRVNVEEGRWYEFSCRVYNISDPDGRMSAFVGINPWGGDVFHRTMVWGEEHVYNYRSWSTVKVTAQAFGGRITVAMAGNNDWPTKNNAVYWDDCSIRQVDGAVQPTSTPYPTYTPYPTLEPCATVLPGGTCDYEQIRGIVQTVVAEREPVQWPRR